MSIIIKSKSILMFIIFGIFFTGCADENESDISDEDNELALELWSELDGYINWQQHSDFTGIVQSSSVHGDFVQIWLNETAIVGIDSGGNSLPSSSIIVKEGYPDSTGNNVNNVTVMKKITEYDSENNDWFWASYKSSGEINDAGKINNCISCHNPGKDYILFVDW